MSRKRDPRTIDLSRRIQRAFGARLAGARTGAQTPLLQQDLGNHLGLSRTTISNIECGSQRVFLDQVYFAARALGVDARDLLPPMDEVFPTTPVQVAPDDPLSAQAQQSALNVAAKVEERLKGSLEHSRTKRRPK